MTRSGILCALVLCMYGAPGADTIRILPLGNSITESISPHVSYRCRLWELLTSLDTFDFVGSRRGVATSPPGTGSVPSPCTVGEFDDDHEGHCGWRANEILHGALPANALGYPGSISTWLRSYPPPDMVLLHLGTVDLLQNETPSSTSTELGHLIDTLRARNPSVVIFLAKLIPLGNNVNTKVVELNGLIPSLASRKNTKQSPVIVVDQYSGYDGVADNWDRIHPTESGARKMASKWFDAIRAYLSGTYAGGPIGGRRALCQAVGGERVPTCDIRGRNVALRREAIAGVWFHDGHLRVWVRSR